MTILDLYDQGMKVKQICKLHGCTTAQLDGWLRQRRAGGSFSPVVTKRRAGRNITKCKVSVIRRVLGMLDQGVTVQEVSRELRLARSTVYRFRDTPAYREATYEYNPDFVYDSDDLTDRSVVAHALCRVEPNPDERLDMVLAIVGLHREDMVKENRKLFGHKNRKGAQ